MIFTTLVVLIFYSASFAADDEKYVVLDVESEGATRNEAVEAGWLEGIRTAVGSYIDAKQELNNDQLTERIIAYNRGLVERFEIIGVDDSRAAQGVYKVKQRLWILRDALRDGAKHVTVRNAEISFSPENVKRRREELNLRDLEAKNASQETSKAKSQTGAELLSAMLNRYKPENFLTCYIPGKPEPVKDKQDFFTLNVEINFNEKLYKEAFVPDLIQVLDQIASVKKNTLLVKYKNELRDIASKKGMNMQLSNSIIIKALENENDCTLAVFDKPERFGVRLYGFNADDTKRINAVLENFQARISNIKGLLLELFDENDEVMESIENKFNINFLISNAASNRWSFQPTMLQITKVETTVEAQPSQRKRGMIGEGLQRFSPSYTVLENTQIIVPVAFEMPEEILPYVKKIRASLLSMNLDEFQNEKRKQNEAKIRQILNIRILNGDGEKGITRRAAQLFQRIGIEVSYTGNARHYGYKTSHIIYPLDGDETVRAEAQVLAKLCGITNESLIYADKTATSLTLILGHDKENLFIMLENCSEEE